MKEYDYLDAAANYDKAITSETTPIPSIAYINHERTEQKAAGT